jgi:hypothetical protein
LTPTGLTRGGDAEGAVLKRCVYGVDLNAMAVELAKVSLWLDAFTLGAPLSFLDHHLKHGNSLIGARVADVQKALEGDLTLFSRNKFAGVMLATNLMQQVSYLSDNTVEQSRRAPRPTAMPATTSRPTSACWMCILRAGSATRPARKERRTLDLTVEFLRRDDTGMAGRPDNRRATAEDDCMKAGLVAKPP